MNITLMPNKALLVKAMQTKADTDALPENHEMRLLAAKLQAAIQQSPFDWGDFNEAWSRARRCYDLYTGEKFV